SSTEMIFASSGSNGILLLKDFGREGHARRRDSTRPTAWVTKEPGSRRDACRQSVRKAYGTYNWTSCHYPSFQAASGVHLEELAGSLCPRPVLIGRDVQPPSAAQAVAVPARFARVALFLPPRRAWFARSGSRGCDVAMEKCCRCLQQPLS